MKKSISLLLAVLMVLSSAFILCACNNEGDGDTTTSTDTADVTTLPEGSDTTVNTDTSVDSSDESTTDSDVTTEEETTTEELATPKMTIAGVDVKEFVIVAEHMSQAYIDKFVSRIKTVGGYTLPVLSEAGDNEHIIYLNVSYNSYCETLVTVEDGNLLITTSSSRGLNDLVTLFNEATTTSKEVLELKEGFQKDGGYEIADYSTYSKLSDLKISAATENQAVGYYKAGEKIAIIASLKDKDGNPVGCPQFSYVGQVDGNTSGVSGKVDGGSGEGLIEITMPTSGFLRVQINISNGKTVLTGAGTCTIGAAAGAADLKANADAPADFEDFWKAEIEKLLKVDPKATRFEQTTSSKIGSGYTGYIVEVPINDDGDFVTGIVTVPNNASKNSLKIVVEYMYYSGSTNVNAILSCQSNTIKFSVLAHGLHLGDPEPSGSYYNIGSSSRDTSYFKNMYLRDVQAIRFLIDKYGASGEGLWNGKDITVTGGSQGGCQSIAVAGLASFAGFKVTNIQVNVVWMCDLAGYKDPTKRVKSEFIPSYTDALLYFDSVNFGKYINADTVSFTVGLADTTAVASGITCLYNTINVANKSITYVQSGTHTTYYDASLPKFTIKGEIAK